MATGPVVFNDDFRVKGIRRVIYITEFAKFAKK